MKSRLLLAVFLGLSLFVFLAGGCQRMEAPKESQPESKEAQKMEKPSAVDSPTEGGEPLPSDVVSPDDGLELSAMQQLMKDAAPKDGKKRLPLDTSSKPDRLSMSKAKPSSPTTKTSWCAPTKFAAGMTNLRVTQDGKPHESKAAAFMRGQVQIRDFQANRFHRPKRKRQDLVRPADGQALPGPEPCHARLCTDRGNEERPWVCLARFGIVWN